MREEYLDLLKKSLADTLHINTYSVAQMTNTRGQPTGVEIYRSNRSSYDKRQVGQDWPLSGETMIGIKRLGNIQHCVEKILKDDVPGDLIETGVWRGGATIFMRGCLKAYGNLGDLYRLVWVADSFEGLPKPTFTDDTDTLHTLKFLAVSEEEVRENFNRYGLLDDRVVFLKGWFKDTLPKLRERKWAFIRLDGDMYESTMEGLENLYPQLSLGGFITIDDYGALESCQQAVDKYRKVHNITEPIQKIDWTGVYWRKI